MGGEGKPRNGAKPSGLVSQKSWAETAGSGDRHGVWGVTGVAGEALAITGTLLLVTCCPIVSLLTWFLHTKMESSVTLFARYAQEQGVQGLLAIWPRPSAEAWAYVAAFGVAQALMQLYVPGKVVKGPVTPKGNVPVYVANGVQCYVLTVAAVGGGYWAGIFDAARVYDLFGEILAALNYFSLAFCVMLYVKGYVSPSSSDSGTSGSLVYDFYWGMELYPRFGKWFDLKTWTNCRMGMMGWGVLVLCYACKQHELHGGVTDGMLVSVALMHLYIAKFFLWESGYWASMDIAHDRAGYYLCWGCLNWVPSVYTSPALALVHRPENLGAPLALAILAAGAAGVLINYDSDRQRQTFRESGGKKKVWGKAPRKITARYETGDGQTKTSLLLTSGWWGLARHFHYLPELGAALCWTLPNGLSHLLPYFYFVFLLLLLTDRAFRDDARCAAKYGKHWEEYVRLVPYKIIPGLF